MPTSQPPLRGWLTVLAGMLVAASVCGAVAQSAPELRNAGRQIARDIAVQKASGTFDAAAQQHAVDRLGKLTLVFIDLSDRAANVGSEARQREALLGAYQAVSGPLEDIYEQQSTRLDRMAKQVMDEDGDLEALYDTQPFKEAQTVASQSLYFLNWLHYYGARLYEGARRKELLEQAQRGFSEFAVGDRRTELLVESLLGRGLCHLELGNTEFAVYDLQAVIKDPQASPERKAKARLALLDAYVRAGHVAEALQLSEQLLGAGGRAQDNVVRFLRIRLLLAAAKGASSAEAERYRQRALADMDQLRRAGGGWEEKVSALLSTGIDNPEKWSENAGSPFAKWELAKLLIGKGNYKQAAPLLESVVSSSDADMRRHHGEARYMLGLAEFQAGRYQEAAEQLDAALQEPSPSYGSDAAYMRFKAMEAWMAKDPGADVGGRYERVIREYLTRYPDHHSAFEARFRLGELLQAQRRFSDAMQSYAAVHGDPGFELRAQLATMQCAFELLQADDQRSPSSRRALLSDIGAGLERFDRQAAEFDKRTGTAEQVPLNDMRAKVAIMRAVYRTLQPEPDYPGVVEALAGFEKRYPEHTDLLPQVVRLRLAAFQHLGRFTDAEAEVRARGALLLASAGAPAIEELAIGFIRQGARNGDAGAAQAAQQVAVRLYEQLTSDEDTSARTKLTLARLYENTGEPKKAAAMYAESLQANANSAAALRGLARIAEAEHRIADALGYWERLEQSVRAGDPAWYEAHYQAARLTQAMGKKQDACALLAQLKPAMPGLADADLRKQMDALYQQVCH
jgi:TolA-binding protein